MEGGKLVDNILNYLCIDFVLFLFIFSLSSDYSGVVSNINIKAWNFNYL